MHLFHRLLGNRSKKSETIEQHPQEFPYNHLKILGIEKMNSYIPPSKSQNFSYDYLRDLVKAAKSHKYEFMTLKEFREAGCPKERAFIMKHDIDAKPVTLQPLLDVERELGIKSTLYFRITANDYNFMSYLVLPQAIQAHKEGFEVGLHTNFLEFAILNDLDPMQVLESEITLMKQYIDIKSLSTHRDLNYVHNALPWIEQNWKKVSKKFKLDYQAYDPMFMDNTIYVNEGYSPHLCWRNKTPFDAISTGESVYMLTHNHWWFDKHPFALF